MARTNDPDSATSQFFINVNDNDPLNYSSRQAGYAVFGKTVEGDVFAGVVDFLLHESADFFSQLRIGAFDLETVLAEVKARDDRDSAREAAPLKPAEDAVAETVLLDARAASRTISCKSSGRLSNTDLLIIISSVGPGSCQPG